MKRANSFTVMQFTNRWELIDSEFKQWFDGQTWDKQQKRLTGLMNENLGISLVNCKKIFTEFNSLFPENCYTYSFDWDDYQLPVLVVISSKYVKNQ